MGLDMIHRGYGRAPGADRAADRCRRHWRRDTGFMTPVGWVYLTLSLAFIVALVAVIVMFVAGSHSKLAQRTADLVAARGAQLGLSLLITPVAPNAPGSVLDMAPDVRTQVVTEYIQDNVLPPNSSLSRYLAPLQTSDVVIVVNPVAPVSATVTVTARAGRNAQFISTATAVGTVAAANYVAPGRVSSYSGLPGGVLPLALDESALAATLGSQTADLAERRAVALDLGSNAFPASVDSAQIPGSHLLAVSSFLASESTATPSPAMRTGQQLILARWSESEGQPQAAANDAATTPGRDASGAFRAEDLLAGGIYGRPVIVPVVRGDVVTAFAVGRLEARDGGLVFEPIESVLSPLTGYDVDAPGVPPRIGSVGLALALKMPATTESPGEFILGTEEAVG